MSNFVLTNFYKNIAVGRSTKASSRQPLLAQVPDVVSEYKYGLERLESTMYGFSNPKFKLTSSHNNLVDGPNKGIIRGYIRRSTIDPSDPTSRYRLYFMFNPEEIERNYMAYLDQQALDPYNNMFGSNNMTAPPGILDFSFDLIFDRQLEVASDPNHPGIKVDYDFFDIVVRGIVPDVNNNGNSIPDNGIMMVNPRNVAVIFSQDLAVHGRPYNSSVRFEKFNNRMVPVRMVISITLKAFYIGPVQTLPNYNQFTSESIFSATIPYDENVKYEANFIDVDQAGLVDNPSVTTNSSFPSPYVQGVGTYTQPTDGLYATKGVILTEDQMADLVVGSGLRGDAAAICISIAYRESHFNSGAININPSTNDHSVGLFQINQLAFHGTKGTDDELMVPAHAMQVFMDVSNHGTDFHAWYVTPSGDPTHRGYDLTFLTQARQLVQVRGGYN